jgi:uncharacterized membrane protein YdbT with pleckstrin-like domain
MSYVQRVLQPGEVVRHVSGLHWVSYLPGLLVWIVAGIVLLVVPDEPAFLHWVRVGGAWLCAAVGVVLLARAAFDQWMTEIAVTDRRVISKKGFIWRNTTEMHMDKVESVEVKQSVLGRILDYGDVEIRGVGSGFEPLRNIAAPIDLRNHITAV